MLHLVELVLLVFGLTVTVIAWVMFVIFFTVASISFILKKLKMNK